MSGPATPMTKGEREELQRLIRQRERVLKSAAKQRTTQLLADFENQMASEFSFDDDAVWAAAEKAASAEVAKAEQAVATRCRELGIPERFAPGLELHWRNRGYGNLLKSRRDELRRVAQSKAEAIERQAITQIELSCLDFQQRIAVSGLTSDAARELVGSLPSMETLMPRLSYSELAGEADPPLVERLVTPHALQRAQAPLQQPALTNGVVTPGLASAGAGGRSDGEARS